MRANSLHHGTEFACYKVLKYIKNGQCLHGSGVKNLREAALEVIVNFFLVGGLFIISEQ